MDYEVYDYHCSKHVTKPRKTSANIKGVELEISDYDSGWLLDELVEEGILTVPETEYKENKNEYTIAVEDDGSVYKELIFKASCNATILKGVKALETKLHDNICNNHSTSCHIHINNAYLKEHDIDRLDIVKCAEFMAPILFKISGRDSNSLNSWAGSILSCSIDDYDLMKRARKVDNIDDPHCGRYSIVNCGPMNTTEIRIFSNYYNFDYRYIKMYLETVDFIIETAEFMHNKLYSENYDELINKMKEFFGKRRFKEITTKHSIKGFFVGEKERRILNLESEIKYIRDELKRVKERTDVDKGILLLRMLRDYNNRFRLPKVRFNLLNIDLNEIENNLVEIVENDLENLNE